MACTKNRKKIHLSQIKFCHDNSPSVWHVDLTMPICLVTVAPVGYCCHHRASTGLANANTHMTLSCEQVRYAAAVQYDT